MTEIRGGNDAGTVTKELEKTDGFLDSWHAGTNPKTISPVKKDVIRLLGGRLRIAARRFFISISVGPMRL